MSYTLTPKMKLPKPDAQTQQQFELAKYNQMLDLIDTLAGITPVASLAAAPTTNLYDGRMIITRDTTNVYVYNFGLSKWEQANIQTPAQISTSQVAMVTEAQRKSLSRVNLLDGTVVFNTTSNKLEIYKKENFTWYDAVANVTWVTTDPNAGQSANVNFTILGTETTALSSTPFSNTIGNQRRIDRMQNGNLMQIVFRDGVASPARVLISTDNGATWNTDNDLANPSGATGYSGSTNNNNGSLFIDVDDYAHWVFKDGGDGYIYYRRGTPNTARTAYTWSSAYQFAGTAYSYPDVVAFRNTDTSVPGSYMACVVLANTGNVSQYKTTYFGIRILSNGTIEAVNANIQVGATLPGATSVFSFPSIDFKHNGDGKTLVASEIYVSWSNGTAGSGYGIRFIRGTITNSVISFGTDREIDTNHYNDGPESSLNCMFDGTRVVIAGSAAGASGWDVVVHDRDSADTTTTLRTVMTYTSGGAQALNNGSCSYDNAGNVYVFGRELNSANGSRNVGMRRWTRSTNTFEARQTIDATGNTNPYISCRRGYGGNRLDFIWVDGTASPYQVKYNNLTAIPPGIQGNLGPVVTLRTSSSLSTSTAYGNQRKVDRCQNGVLWAGSMYAPTAGNTGLGYSVDNGATWTDFGGAPYATPSSNYTQNYSLFIDIDDYMHIVYKDPNDGYIKYVRGTPNTARTSYTWSAAQVIFNNATYMDYPDIVAFRDPATSGAWVAWAVFGRNDNSADKAFACRINISAAAVVTVQGFTQISASVAAANSNPGYPSIDFRHTGDGKTVATQPDLFIAWSAGSTGSGYGIRFKKLTYSAGSWTQGTEREIDSSRQWDGPNRFLNCLFDGTRVIIVGQLYNGSQFSLMCYERDTADTTTTTRTLLANSNANGDGAFCGTSTYDKDGNIYVIGMDGNQQNLYLYKWTRATTALSPRSTAVESFSNAAPGYASFRRGYKTNATDQLDFVYTAGTASPWTVKAGKIT